MTAVLAQRVAEAGYDWIVPAWDAPANVLALSTSRNGGVAVGARATLDIGPALPMRDDQFAAVLENRRRLAQFLPSSPVWLAQVHAAQVVQVDHGNVADLLAAPPTADAAVTRARGIVLGVRTADCLPVLFADSGCAVIGAAHAGWRGLASGVLEATLQAMDTPPREIVAWLGPAIGPRMFEVGADVFDAFCATDSGAASCFAPHRDGKWLADLYGLAKRRLVRAGVTTVAGGGHCTMTESDRFFSWRRDKGPGRMATLVWLGAGA